MISLDDLFSQTDLATLAEVCAATDVHPTDAHEWAVDNGVLRFRGELLFTRDDAEDLLDAFEEADDCDEDDQDEEQDEDDES